MRCASLFWILPPRRPSATRPWSRASGRSTTAASTRRSSRPSRGGCCLIAWCRRNSGGVTLGATTRPSWSSWPPSWCGRWRACGFGSARRRTPCPNATPTTAS
uniref:DNA packaging terminase subunit 1 n=1 Tax=Human herpesvirus 2 TaxID=10310 RepID=A0A0Y0R752_HHV2|nr:DNA packaging terminase subunit 1 [Human alphaherpesvirus 2]QBH76101.1 hypothetical protein [Human alphaherpesvirus 2]